MTTCHCNITPQILKATCLFQEEKSIKCKCRHALGSVFTVGDRKDRVNLLCVEQWGYEQ